MAGRRVAVRRRKAPLADYVRLACSGPDAVLPEPARPRRIAMATRVAVVIGVLLVAVGVGMAVWMLLIGDGVQATAGGHGSHGHARSSATSTAAAPLSPHDPASPAAREGMGEVVVHVVGAVVQPGVVHLAAGARVADAIAAAGGARADADANQLNLARPLSDGEQVRVPAQGEDASQWAGAGPASTANAVGGTEPSGGAGVNSGGKININTSDAAALEELPGIGPALAERIVAWRSEHGPFASVEALAEVPGIGQAKLAALADAATV